MLASYLYCNILNIEYSYREQWTRYNYLHIAFIATTMTMQDNKALRSYVLQDKYVIQHEKTSLKI